MIEKYRIFKKNSNKIQSLKKYLLKKEKKAIIITLKIDSPTYIMKELLYLKLFKKRRQS
jgi:hypothetical protein